MERKYYFRGLGIGIAVTAVLMGIMTSHDKSMTDQEIIARAKELGMVENTVLSDMDEEETEQTGNSEAKDVPGTDSGKAEAGGSLEEKGIDNEEGRKTEDGNGTEDAGRPENKAEIMPEQDTESAGTKVAAGGKEENKASGVTGNLENKVSGVAGNAGNKASGVAGNAGNKTSGVAGSAGNKASGVAGNAGNKTSGVAGNAGNKASNVTGNAGNKVSGVTGNSDSEAAGEEREDTGDIITSAVVRTITINSGDGSHTVARKLADAGVVMSADTFDEFLCRNGYDKKLRTGTFSIPADASDEQIARIVTGAE